MSFLSKSDFQNVIENAPLVSIDLIVCNKVGSFLVGKRLNSPAKGYWFVPGGRVRKNEKIFDAFERLLIEELNITITDTEVSSLGLYEHFYKDSVFDNKVSTHYVVHAYKLSLQIEEISLPSSQHSNYKWINPEEILSCDDVHDNTKAYFQSNTNADIKFSKN